MSRASSTSSTRRPTHATPQTNSGTLRPTSPANSLQSGIDTVVTRLLVSTKTLLEGLTQWSIGNVSDDRISDIYVKLGNDFNAACAAFAKERISMADLLSVPDDLRVCLETCLSSDEASPATLERHLPQIKNIIVRLLQGLKAKQAQYKALVAERKAAALAHSNGSSNSGPPPPIPVVPVPYQQPQSQRAYGSNVQVASAESRRSFSHRSTASSGSMSSTTDRRTMYTSSHTSEHREDRELPQRPESAQSQRNRRQPSPTSTGIRRSISASSMEPPTIELDSKPMMIPRSSSGPRLPSEGLASFESLRNSDNLARRASKRFSKYTLDKMTGSPSRDDQGGTPRRSKPPLPPTSNMSPFSNASKSPVTSTALMPPTPHEFDSYYIPATETNKSAPTTPGQSAGRSSPEFSRSRQAPMPDDVFTASVPHPKAKMSVVEEADESATSNNTDTHPTGAGLDILLPTPPDPTPQYIFVQLGRETKKVFLDADQLPPTLPSLRLLFADKFGYNPGLEDFPAIYIRDPRLGVEYELEEMSEVKEGVVLSLNIEPLDQVKQHIDIGMSALSRDLHDMKSSLLAAMRRASVAPLPANTLSPRPDMTSSPSMRTPTSPVDHVKASNVPLPISPVVNEKLMTDIRHYSDEVQSIRRDFAVLRQLYTDYGSEHKTVLSNLRTQLEKVKALSAAKPSSSRSFIEAGKQQLDSRSQELLTKVENLMDTVEGMRDDVTVRRMRPAPTKMAAIRKEIGDARAELDDLRAYINTVRPSWKKTWSDELQNVVEEERFLKHQEEMLHELSEDHRDCFEMFGIIDELMNKQPSGRPGATRPKLREFVPPEPDAVHGGLSTVMTEVRSLAVDPERRLKAIRDAELARNRALAERKASGDAFANELGGFVDGKMLKKTGGAEEAERIRKLKSEATIKQLFTQAQQTALPDSPGSGKEKTGFIETGQ